MLEIIFGTEVFWKKISTPLVMCTVTALCALAIFSIKRRPTK